MPIMKLSKVIKYVVSLGFAALLVYASFHNVDWNEFARGVKECGWGFIALGMAASIAAFFFRALRWRLLMQPFDRSLDILTAFDGVNIGYLVNFVFPRAGEVVRCAFVSRRSHVRHGGEEGAITFEQAVGTVLLSRVWDILVVFVLIAVLLVMRWQMFGDFFTNRIFAPMAGRFTPGMIAAMGAAVVVVAVLAVASFRGSSSFSRKVSAFLKGMADGFAGFARMEGKLPFLVLTVLLWAMYWLMSMSVIWAMPQLESLGWVDAWFVCLAGSVAWMVPVPGGFGAYHGIVALALSSVYSLGWDTGLLCATINHEAQTITMLLCGTISYIVELVRK